MKVIFWIFAAVAALAVACVAFIDRISDKWAEASGRNKKYVTREMNDEKK